MDRLTQTSDKGGVAFTFDLDVTCQPSEMKKILKIAEKLKEYEDLEEQGLLLRSPCKKEDIVYDVVLCNDGKYHMFEMMVCAINPFGATRKGNVWNVYLECIDDCSKAYGSFYDFGKTVFLTQAEAEQKLKEMENDLYVKH